MKLLFKIDGKKTSRKAVKELVGEDRLNRMIKESKETMEQDPLIENDYWIGNGMLTIQMDPWA